MIKLSLRKIAEILDGQLIGNDLFVENISTDTRISVEDGLFFALKGENFDAHNYLAQAIQQGCTAIIVDHQCDVNVPQIVVKDTRVALGKLAQWLRLTINPKTVAMTGSSGKTTVKEMTAAILQEMVQDPSDVLFTSGNFNNDIGVPLTLLRLTEQHRFAVIELGANHIGEIAYTTDLTHPDVALVNNVAAAHLEGFGSIAGVAQAKGEIYLGLSENGVAIINLDCHYLEQWKTSIASHKVRSFSLVNSQADYYAENILLTVSGATFILNTPSGNVEIDLPYLGKHNISNALAATALAMNVGATLQQVKQGLEKKSQVKGRLYPIQPCENLLLLDDTYNANVDSLQSAISVLAGYKDSCRILVVGDMAELGEKTKDCHQQVASYTQQSDIDIIISFGLESRVISAVKNGQHFEDKVDLLLELINLVKSKLENNQKVVVLAKGSRRMKMEDVIYSLEGAFNVSLVR
ncbi:UDP-N-acetylmuramoyl-tripeptide--D-alanyl-D-alanine ligase [Bisgaardia hudsonensis]|uniref:UDP-N-acetylmuramoyl-tripeptide--D-alanyl-D-alanine ligase n=1 Tax=Bisgaardia hudsonensis TaxID=109472 RepID=A0A4R2N078_9PAST|nr:UDP-N-acetylmuramoyl-tripeptide--D-alanyl-D-alanine ligase [Bisgaardia hudsonensis]QLB13926.1 UDP-N-acetylmuramoyl-tripeptide--D-alanyl-D-alanine ligase [Bisgaardia hudsonensis]TCP12769.1 UDP-N-acetylmuramoyl-tripeptide--D-alanyl-D-alanine ligase [Bisgaardia hudsonensis]